MLQLQSLNNELVILKLAFDEAIMKGRSFEEVKRVYIQIKEIEKLILDRELSLLKQPQ